MEAVSDLPLGLDPALQASLAAQVPTVQDFLTRRQPLQLPGDADGGQEQQAVQALLAHVRQHIAPPVRTGAAAFAALRTARLLPTGCASLDEEVLRGGLREGHLLEVAGEPGAGKSQLAMQLAANTALRGERVLFVDTEGSFSARRFGAMHRALLTRQPGGGNADVAAELARDLECLALFRVHDAPQLLQLVAALPARLLEEERARQQHPGQAGQEQPRTTLLVVDSASFVGAAAMLASAGGPPGGGSGAGDQGHQGQALLAALGRALKQLAQRFALGVLATNHLVGGTEDARPALGEVWRVQANQRITLSCQGGRVRRATLTASSLAPCGACAWFELTSGGLEPVRG